MSNIFINPYETAKMFVVVIRHIRFLFYILSHYDCSDFKRINKSKLEYFKKPLAL